MNPDLTWVSGWCSSSVYAQVSAKGQSQLRRSFVGELETVDEWFGDGTLEELFGEDIVTSMRGRFDICQFVLKLRRRDNDLWTDVTVSRCLDKRGTW